MTIRRAGTACAFAAVAVAALSGACSHKAPADISSDPEAVSVDVGTLWNRESATDPITAYRVRLATDPENAGLHNNLGNAYVLENYMKEAIREFKTAARLEPRSPVPFNNLGTAYKKMGRTGSAKDAFQKAIDVDPRYALAYYNLGTIHDEEGDYDKAIELYLQAISLRPDLTDVKVNPQVVNNRNLMVVKLRHYLEESGNIALPLDRLPE